MVIQTKIITCLWLVTFTLTSCGKSNATSIGTDLPNSRSPNIKFECPTIELQNNFAATGTLILDGFDTYLMNMSTKAMTLIDVPTGNLESFAVSPNRKWIIYNATILDKNLVYLKNDLVVTGVDDQIIKILPWESNWGSVNWLDDNRLIIRFIQGDDSSYQIFTEIDFLVLNPFTDDKHTLKANYPDMYGGYPLPNWDGWGIAAYNAQLNYVVYLQGGISGPFFYTLWDIQKQKMITQLQVFGEFQAVPRWSSDGNKFAVAPSLLSKGGDSYPSYEIFSVAHDGIVSQLTHLSDYYPWVYVADLSWSPDDRYIAFWYSNWADSKNQPYFDTLGDRYFGIVDTQTGITTSYCIHGELNAEIGIRKFQPPLWSPDSKQVIIQSQVGEDFLNFQTVLIDVQENRAYHIADNLEPVGWMISP